jgi:hypothetical protein
VTGAARAHVAFFAALTVATLWAAPLHLPLNNPNEGVRVFAAAALVEHGTFAIDDVVKRWGYIDDKAKRGGRLYSSKAPLPSLLAACAYAVVHPFTGDLPRPTLTRLCRLTGDTLPSLVLALLLLLALSRRLADARAAPLVVGALVLCTGTLASMNVLSGHAIAALATALALVLATEQAPSRRQLALLGGACALAVGSEYPAALAVVVVVGLALARHGVRVGGWIALGAAPFSALLAIAHTAMFGAPWRTGYSFLENKGYEALVTPGFFGVGAPHLDAFATSFFSLELGLFVFAPVTVVGLFALRFVPRDVRIAAVLLTLAYALFIAGFGGWRGGWSVGPRYIAELSGALAVCVALAIECAPELWRARLLGALALSAGAGFVTAGLAGAWFPHLPDTLRNPVIELVIPLVQRDFSPDTPLLTLGASPGMSSRSVLIALLAPLALALTAAGVQRARGLAIAFVAGSALSLGVCAVGPRTSPDRAGAELRRMFDNFQPDAGNPILQSAPDDPRVWISVDRGRFAWPRLLSEGCALTPAPGPLWHGDTGRLPAGALLVVSDRRAPDGEAIRAGTSLVVASTTDLARHARLGLPCEGPIIWLDEGAPRPTALAALPELSRNGAFVLLARAPRH